MGYFTNGASKWEMKKLYRNVQLVQIIIYNMSSLTFGASTAVYVAPGGTW